MSALDAGGSRRENAPLPKAVRRACEAMRAAPERAFDLKELAAIAQTPARTLQRQFAAFLGKSPLDVLRDIRLEAARQSLLASSVSTKVADVASRCGLTHMGRFSVEYRRRYGETPSQTLARQEHIVVSMPRRLPPVMRNRERPAIAVIPVEVTDADRPLARGIADAMSSALVRAGFALTTHAPGARYHLVSAFRGDGRQGRLSYRLIDRESGRLIWAHRHDGPCEDAFSFEDRVATQVAAAIRPSLGAAEITRAQAKPEREATSYDFAMKAMPHVLALDGEAASRALDLLDRAMGADPDHALSMALAAWCHAQRVVYRFTHYPEGEARLARNLAHRAMALDGDATVLAIAGNALNAAHDLEGAGQAIGQALALDGGSAWAWGRSGFIDTYRGEARSAIGRFATALELAPHDPLAFNNYVGLGCAQFGLGRYAEAARFLERGFAEHPSAAWTHRMLCPAYVLSSDRARAQQSLQAMRGLYPDLTISQVTSAIPLPPATLDLVADALDTLHVAL